MFQKHNESLYLFITLRRKLTIEMRSVIFNLYKINVLPYSVGIQVINDFLQIYFIFGLYIYVYIN